MFRIVRASTLRRLRELEARFMAPAEPAAAALVERFSEAVQSGRWARDVKSSPRPKDTP